MSGITLQKGDYVVHKDMTFEQYERFHNEAIKRGYLSYANQAASHRFSGEITIIDEDGNLCRVSMQHIFESETRNVTSYFTQEHLPEQSIRDILLEAHKKIQQQHKLYIETVYFHEPSRTMNGEIDVSNIKFEGEAL